MRRLYLVRPVKRAPQPREQHAAKVIALRVRHETRRDAERPRGPDRPAAA
jgi:hypothetical protein